jgi:acyl-CoA dehydrogenase
MGALPIAAFGTPDQRASLLPKVVSGELYLTAALEEGGAGDATRPSVTADNDGSGRWLLNGTRINVPAADIAARVLVPARAGSGPAMFLVDPADPSVSRDPVRTTNRQAHCHLRLEATPAEPLGDLSTRAEAISWTLQRALVGVCALQVGVAEEALAMAAQYSSNRIQFGRPLSTFQSASARAADAYIDTEAMRVTMWQAAWRLDSELAGGEPTATAAVEVAKWWASEGGHRVVHAAQHLHGGVGADVEYPVHRYFLWGKQLDVTLGCASAHLAGLGRVLAAAGSGG